MEEARKTLKLAVYASKMKTKDGKDFLAFSAVSKNNEKVTVKFPDGVNRPKEAGLYTVEFSPLQSSVTKDKNGYLKMWIRETVSITKGNAVAEARSAIEVANLFEGCDEMPDELPF